MDAFGMMDEIRVAIAALFGTGGAGIIWTILSRLIARWGDITLDRQEAEAEETRAEAAKDTTLAGVVERLQSDVDQLKTEQAITKTERDAAIEESRAYKIALEQSNDRYEVLQNEFSVMKSDYSKQGERIEKLETAQIEMQKKFDSVVGERDNLAQELETERKNKLELEKVAEKERHQHVVELTRRDTKIEILEKSVDDLRKDIRDMMKEAVASASESAETKPEPPPSEGPEPQESSEIHTQENQ